MIRILIVDDEEEFARTLASRLALRDMSVRCVFGGEEALEALARETPDLVLLDMRMPGLSGVDVLRAIRSGKLVSTPNDLPVIIITGHCSETDCARAEELGIQGYLAKPLHFEQLLSAIAGAASAS